MLERDNGRKRDPLVRPVKFPLGLICMTPGVQREVPPSELLRAYRRHAQGDWGELCDDDRVANERALESGTRLMSAYTTNSGVTFWIITEWDRSATTALLPEEY